jgi:hypothetical protein
LLPARKLRTTRQSNSASTVLQQALSARDVGEERRSRPSIGRIIRWSPREIVERLVASVAELGAEATGEPLGEHAITEPRRSMAAPDRTSASHQHAERAVSGFTDLLERWPP